MHLQSPTVGERLEHLKTYQRAREAGIKALSLPCNTACPAGSPRCASAKHLSEIQSRSHPICPQREVRAYS
uniref:Uncharacterized protein n=1 Tax=Mycena chlorophos TaxID=658473 RepID=A0ABQ0LFQ6_MYCCL|nr:predicted protein [Mycena chlorophos]